MPGRESYNPSSPWLGTITNHKAVTRSHPSWPGSLWKGVLGVSLHRIGMQQLPALNFCARTTRALSPTSNSLHPLWTPSYLPGIMKGQHDPRELWHLLIRGYSFFYPRNQDVTHALGTSECLDHCNLPSWQQKTSASITSGSLWHFRMASNLHSMMVHYSFLSWHERLRWALNTQLIKYQHVVIRNASWEVCKDSDEAFTSAHAPKCIPLCLSVDVNAIIEEPCQIPDICDLESRKDKGTNLVRVTEAGPDVAAGDIGWHLGVNLGGQHHALAHDIHPIRPKSTKKPVIRWRIEIKTANGNKVAVLYG